MKPDAAYVEIPVAGPARPGLVLVDREDAGRIAGRRICLNGAGYPFTNGAPRGFLHRLLVNAPPGSVVCHLNGDPLDCRKGNLLVADQATNLIQQRSTRGRRFVGVRPDGRRWRARFTARMRLGTFATREEAALVRDMYMRCRFGHLATYNYPLSPEMPFCPAAGLEAPQLSREAHPVALLAAALRAAPTGWGAQRPVVFECWSAHGSARLWATGHTQMAGFIAVEVAGEIVYLRAGAAPRCAVAPSLRRACLETLRGLLAEEWTARWVADGRERWAGVGAPVRLLEEGRLLVPKFNLGTSTEEGETCG